jgi:hypothetical protein
MMNVVTIVWKNRFVGLFDRIPVSRCFKIYKEVMRSKIKVGQETDSSLLTNSSAQVG